MKRIFIILLITSLSLINKGCTKEESVKYELTSNVVPSTSGKVEPSSGTFDEGETIIINAIPSKGFSFKMWQGDLSGNTNPHNFKISKDTEAIAVFERTDSDQDGVPDDSDQCENTPSDQEVDEMGCAASQKDSDNDGVVNSLDLCPETSEGEEVNENGCSASQIDSDEDGINDDTDNCPETPINDDVDENGCSESQKDSDNDGITDDQDNCPGTQEGASVDDNGCSAMQSDTDMDGVMDDMDNCNDTPSGETVDANGCSDSQKDADNDGVTDDEDECPNTPNGEETDGNGCSLSQTDADSDGINNEDDLCADTPEDESVDSNGCSESQKDSDSDGVNDAQDACPNTPSGESVNTSGCAASQTDSDSDGINNSTDECPNTPSGETVDSNGCSDNQRDSDSDGVLDINDKCPDTPSGESVDTNGCSTSQKTYVPDDYFEQTLINEGYDDFLDNYVITSNIIPVTDLFIQQSDESYPNLDLTGIEDFKNLTHLNIYGFYLGNLDLSIVPSLTEFTCSFSIIDNFISNSHQNIETIFTFGVSFKSFSIIDNPNLLQRSGEDCSFDTMIVSGNSSMTSFGFSDNGVGYLEVKNSFIQEIYCSSSRIEYALIQDNPLLESIDGGLGVYGFKELILRNNPILKEIFISGSQNIENIELEGAPNLESLTLTECSLTKLDVSTNLKLVDLDVRFGPELCIKVNQNQLDNIPNGWQKDLEDFYTLNCD